MSTINRTKHDTISKRISRNAVTHRQSISDVMDSLTIPKDYNHLLPAITKAVSTIINYGNDARQLKAVKQLIAGIDAARTVGYMPTCSSSGYMPMSDGPDAYYENPIVDKEGNITRPGGWSYGHEAEILWEKLSDTPDFERDFDDDEVILKEMINAANRSQIFSALGIELVLLDGLLVYGGHTN